MTFIFKKSNFIYVWVFISVFVYSQKTQVYLDCENDYKEAVYLFQKNKFPAAQRQFQKVLNKKDEFQGKEIIINSLYYEALCALNLNNSDAEYLLTNFINQYPELQLSHLARFNLGSHLFDRRKYDDAIALMEDIQIDVLDNRQLEEYFFKLGYAYYKENNKDEAAKKLKEIKDFNGNYTSAAKYYYAHIIYEKGDYALSLPDFLILLNDDSYKAIVPYYIAQIYYLQGKYNDLIKFAKPMLEEGDTKKKEEISRYVGEAFYNQKQFKDAIPYLRQFTLNAKRVKPENYYHLAYCYYKTENYEAAVNYYEKVFPVNDTLSQTVYYQLADCYLKLGNKQKARSAFSSASKYSFNKVIKEEALFNQAKLAYELSYDPYNEAIVALQDYIDNNPESERLDEARKYLLNIYLITKNYKSALKSLESIKVYDEKLKELHQKIAFNRAVELFYTKEYKNSIQHFEKSRTYTINRALSAASYYWEADANYQLNLYDEAIKNYEKFMYLPGAVSLNYYEFSRYNVAYCFYKKKNYTEAIKWFRLYTTNPFPEDDDKLGDSYLRTADCFYSLKKYYQAIEFYTKAIVINSKEQDYALYQKGVLLGLTNDNVNKVITLDSLIATYPTSQYADDALLEKGRAYVELKDQNEAEETYKTLISNYTLSPFIPNAFLQLGLVYYNTHQDTLAMYYFKEVIEKYPNTKEAKEALNAVKNISIDMADARTFFEYIDQLPFADKDLFSKDSILYEAAEVAYMRGDCKKALEDFNHYLLEFPEGFFTPGANFYRAECFYRYQKYDAALTAYEYVINKGNNIFVETAVHRAASIRHENEEWEKAIVMYLLLDSISGNKPKQETWVALMNCYHKIGDSLNTVHFANNIINTEEYVDPDNLSEAYLHKGHLLFSEGNDSEAEKNYEKVITISKSEKAAEAKYYLALMLFNAGKYEKCESYIFELISEISLYEYWLAKSFILLSDNYLAMNDTFQAKHTLQSIETNYKGGGDILIMVKNKLEAISVIEQDIQMDTATIENDFEVEILEEDSIRNDSVK